jgi:hypothetical protein
VTADSFAPDEWATLRFAPFWILAAFVGCYPRPSLGPETNPSRDIDMYSTVEGIVSILVWVARREPAQLVRGAPASGVSQPETNQLTSPVAGSYDCRLIVPMLPP